MSDYKRGLGQSLGMRQETKINPRLYQAMDLLYMPLMDLQQHLKQELLVNPFLEFSELSDEIEDEPIEEPETDEDEMDWEDILLNGFDAGGGRQEYKSDRETFMPTPAAPPDLWDHLRDQLNLLTLEPRDLLLGEEIVGNIDREGFLTCSLDEVVESLNVHLSEQEPEVWQEMEPYALEEAERMLEVVQGFAPSGIGARDLQETLLIQLGQRSETDGLPYQLVRDHFEQLVNHRWSELSKEHGISAREVQDAAD